MVEQYNKRKETMRVETEKISKYFVSCHLNSTSVEMQDYESVLNRKVTWPYFYFSNDHPISELRIN